MNAERLWLTFSLVNKRASLSKLLYITGEKCHLTDENKSLSIETMKTRDMVVSTLRAKTEGLDAFPEDADTSTCARAFVCV